MFELAFRASKVLRLYIEFLLTVLTLNPKITIAFPNPHCSTIFIASLKRPAIIKWQLLQAVWANTHSYVLHLYCISVGLWIGRVYQKVPWKHECRTLCRPLQVCRNPCSKFRPLWIWHGTMIKRKMIIRQHFIYVVYFYFSAGIGRTGTLLTIDTCMKHIERGLEVNEIRSLITSILISRG